MASTKPNRTARWATDVGTVLEPLSGEKDTGWVVDDKPPARHMNFLQNMAFQWFRWFDERLFDLISSANFLIHPPDPAAGVGGTMTIRGADAVGTDLAGGDADLSGGAGTGTGSSKAALKASTAGVTGATANTPEVYVVADGATGFVDFLKGILNPVALSGLAIDVASVTSEAIHAERLEGGSTAKAAVVAKRRTSASNMADGFGPGYGFTIEDLSSGDVSIALIAAVRDGADNSGSLDFGTFNVGVLAFHLRIRSSGLAEFLKGLTSIGVGINAGVKGTGGSTNGAGVEGTGGSTNGDGVVGTGVGSGDGVVGTGGATNGDGVVGTGIASGAGVVGNAGLTGKGVVGFGGANTVGPGVEGTGGGGGPGVKGTGGGGGVGVEGFGDTNNNGVEGTGDGSGDGVLGIGGSTGKGVVAQADTTSPVRSAFQVVPQDTEPTGPNAVGDIFVTTAGVMKICTVAGTPGTFVSVGAQT